MEKKTDEMTDAMERVNDSLDASGSQTEGEDVALRVQGFRFEHFFLNLTLQSNVQLENSPL